MLLPNMFLLCYFLSTGKMLRCIKLGYNSIEFYYSFSRKCFEINMTVIVDCLIYNT